MKSIQSITYISRRKFSCYSFSPLEDIRNSSGFALSHFEHFWKSVAAAPGAFYTYGACPISLDTIRDIGKSASRCHGILLRGGTWL